MRSVSHCGQTISLYTLHPTWCQRSYTISTKREITSQKVHIVPFFFLSYRLQMKSQWKGLSLTESCVFILTSFTLALQHNRDSPDSATVFFSSQHSQISSYPRSSTWVERSSRESLLCGKRGGGRRSEWEIEG